MVVVESVIVRMTFPPLTEMAPVAAAGMAVPVTLLEPELAMFPLAC